MPADPSLYRAHHLIADPRCRAAVVQHCRDRADRIRAIAALDLAPDHHVLDASCGGGLGLELLMPLVPQGSVSGIAADADLAARARSRNAAEWSAGRMLIETAPAHALPFVDHTFDAVLAVRTAPLCWPDASLNELLRVLRPGGRLALTCPQARHAEVEAAATKLARTGLAVRVLTPVNTILVQSAQPPSDQGAEAMRQLCE
jgi:ubiquinone/menaquinone biosynthesis C-methylase UbiE